MNNFIFKSANRLIKNSPITLDTLDRRLIRIQVELRHQRQDNVDIKLMINKLLVDKHLQMQVDEYFEHGSSPTSDEPNDPEDRSRDLD